MKHILILGAGLSSTTLIKYLLDHSADRWKVRIGDIKPEIAADKIQNHPNGEAFAFDVYNADQRNEEIKKAG